jgi:hypothetical protein
MLTQTHFKWSKKPYFSDPMANCLLVQIWVQISNIWYLKWRREDLLRQRSSGEYNQWEVEGFLGIWTQEPDWWGQMSALPCVTCQTWTNDFTYQTWVSKCLHCKDSVSYIHESIKISLATKNHQIAIGLTIIKIIWEDVQRISKIVRTS